MIEIRAFGGFSVTEEGRPIHFRSRKAAALLAYLAINEGRVIARREIAELLWDDAGIGQARHSLGQALYTLRRTLGGIDLQAGRNDLLMPAGCVDFDVNRAKARISQGLLLNAIRLYKGPFLRGFSLGSCGGFEEWHEQTRLELDRLIWRACRRLLDSAESTADWALLEEVAEIALLIDPYDEDTQRRRLTALAMLGEVRQARREYIAFKRLLADELEREPEADTLALAQRLNRLSVPTDGTREEERAWDDPLPFVGRAGEFARLREAWTLARNGSMQGLVVLGEAGIGKTRLCNRFLRLAALQGGRVLAGRCYPIETRLPYSGAVEALLAGLTADDARKLSPAWSAVVSDLLPELIEGDSRKGAAVPRDEAARRRLFEGIARLLQSASSGAPLVLFLDDFHWADESTAALVHYIARRLRGSPVLVLLALRPEDVRTDSHIRWLLPAGAALPTFQELQLRELPIDAVQQLIRSFAERSGLDLADASSVEITRLGAGRPLFVLELLKALKRGETAAQSVGEKPPDPMRRHFVPVAVQDLLARRLRQLSDEALDVMGALAVLGRGAPIPLIQDITDRSPPELLRGIEELMLKGLVVDDKDAVLLPHDLLREVSYRSLSAPRRRLLHARTAAVLRRTEETQPGTLAVHFDLAGDANSAYRYALEAADMSERVLAPGEVDFFLRMAHANAASDESRLEVEERWAHVLFRFRRFREADLHFRELERRYRERGDERLLLSVRIPRAAIRLKLGSVPVDALIENLRELLGSAESLSYKQGLPQIIRLLTGAAHDAGDRRAILSMIAKLRALAEAEVGTAVGGEALTLVGGLSGLYGSAREGLRYSKRAVESARRLGETGGLIHALLARGSNWLHLGQLANAERDYRDALELGEQAAILDYRNGALNDLAILLTERGEYEEAGVVFARAEQHATEAEASHDLLFVHTNWSLLHLEAGDIERASEAAQSVLSARQQVVAWWSSANAHAVLGLHALERGQLSEANRCRREILALFEGRGFWAGDFSYAEMFLARLASAEGEEERALVRLDHAVASYEGRDVLCWMRLQLERARLLLTLDRAEARRTAKRVRSRAALAGARPLVAKAEAILDRLIVNE